MGDHRKNPTAMMHATRPAGPPPGIVYDIAPKTVIMPKTNVVVMPAERIRKTPEGKVEVFASVVGPDADAPEAWHSPPDHIVIHEEGTTLPEELCDIVCQIHGVRVDSRITDARGNPGLRWFAMGEISRMDLRAFRAKLDPQDSTPALVSS